MTPPREDEEKKMRLLDDKPEIVVEQPKLKGSEDFFHAQSYTDQAPGLARSENGSAVE
jgi:hypothetical protein